MFKTQLDMYSSESEFDNEEVIEKHQIKRENKEWVKLETFPNQYEAQNSLQSSWSRYFSNVTIEGRRVYYRCNKAKRLGPQCSASVHLLYHSDSDRVTVYETKNGHNNHKDVFSRGIDNDVKKIIEDIINDGITKPKQIIRALQSKTTKIPTSVKLKNFLVQFKKKKYGPNVISLGELEQWCITNSEIPAVEDHPYVVSYNIMYADEEYENLEYRENNTFRIFISTKRLLSISSESTHIHADATYKLIWQGFPVLIVGTTDLHKHFHPFGLAITTNEKTADFEFIFSSLQYGLKKLKKPLIQPTALVADASEAIKAAFRIIFNEGDIIMCWSHMKRNVSKRITHIDDKIVQQEIIGDIEKLQLCSSKELFDIASSLFLKKWKIKQKNKSVLDFLVYFENEWLLQNNGWYEGIQLYVPSTNNALEATNKVIKDDGTFRERHVLSRFLVISTKIVSDWSNERDAAKPDSKSISKAITYNLQLWTSAYQWALLQKNIECVENENTKTYYIPAGTLNVISKTEMKCYTTKKWSSFDQFKRSYSFYCLNLDNIDWKASKCNCPAFLKNFICKHVLGVALRLKLCKAPIAAKNIPIGEKRKRGRPAKATKALLFQ